jgi:hypothetical protein
MKATANQWCLGLVIVIFQVCTGSRRNTKKYLHERGKGMKLPKQATGPWPSNYIAKLDITTELSPDWANYYLSLAREGHLDAAFHVFTYRKKKYNARMVFDPTYATINQDDFQTHDWKRFDGDALEPKPSNAPMP